MRKDQASSTAILVTTGLFLLDRARRGSCPTPPEAVLLTRWLLGHYSPLTARILSAMDKDWFQRLAAWIENRTVPGIVEHYAARKQAIEVLAREAVGQGAPHLTVLGAGFDTLACRLSREMPDLHAVEIDHPATQHWKKRGVQEARLDCPNLGFVSEDLGRQFPSSLSPQTRFWVAEGLLMYFSEERVRELFQAVRRCSLSGSRVAFTFMEVQPHGRVDFRQQSGWVNAWLAQRREPFAWGIGREALRGFLTPLGFRPLEIPPVATREMDRLNVGEYLALYEVC